MFYNSCKEGSYSCQAWPGEVTLHPGAWAELVRRERGRVNWMHYVTRSVEKFQVTQEVNCVMVCIKIPFNQIQPGREDVQLQLPVHQHEVQAAEQDPTQDGRPQPGPWADARLRWCHDYHIITAQWPRDQERSMTLTRLTTPRAPPQTRRPMAATWCQNIQTMERNTIMKFFPLVHKWGGSKKIEKFSIWLI